MEVSQTHPMLEFSGVFFGRLVDGTVRVLRLKSNPLNPPCVGTEFQSAEVLLDILVQAESWASVVAGLSAIGETPKRHYEALAFHTNLSQ